MLEDSTLDLNYDSPQEIKALLEIMGLGPRKRWGQNFLINSGARGKIVELLNISKGDGVWEIGPGLGSITKLLIEKEADLKVFEIDPGYVEYLGKAFNGAKDFRIVKGDVLKTWKLHKHNPPVKIVGNLPYNVSSDIISSFIDNNFIPSIMLFTVQREMAQRIMAKPGNKNYSSFSIQCQFACEIKECGVLNPGSFYPVPGVASSIITMKPLERFVNFEHKTLFNKISRDLLLSRRKTIKNNISISPTLKNLPRDRVYEIFSMARVDIDKRAETLGIEDFINLTQGIKDLL